MSSHIKLLRSLVTGANRGIGLGVAECCLANGARAVYSLDFADPGDDFLQVQKRFQGRLHSLKANVTDEDTVTAAIDRVVDEAGSLHGMVVNAGRTNHKAALDFTKEEVYDLFAINVSVTKASHAKDLPIQLFGAFFCARVAARAFIKLGIKGSIVFTASMASYRPNKVLSLQCMSSND